MLKNMGKLAGRTVFISGASRGIGREIALKLAKDRANVVIAAKTAEPHPKLPGTVYTVAKEIEAAGGKALPCVVDIRDEEQVLAAVDQAVAHFGGIDILVNNASAISLTGTLNTQMKKYDLMHAINGRGTFLVSKACAPFLKTGQNPHILNISPPLNLNPKWFSTNVAYTMAKYNMSMCALGMAEEFRSDGVAANCLWPRTAIYTAAMEMLGGSDIRTKCRKPEIMSDAAYAILCRDSHTHTGNFYIDESVLTEEGITDFNPYAYDPAKELMVDFFLDENPVSVHSSQYVIAPRDGQPPKAVSAAQAAPAQATTANGSGEVARLMGAIRALVNEDVVKTTQAIFQFDISGEQGGVWHLDLKNSPGAVGPGAPASAKSDVTLILSEPDFVKIFSGKLSPTTAYMTGKLKLKGDITKAMVLDKLMQKLKAKL